MTTLEERVESLEKANRRWRWAAALMVLVLAALAAAKPGGATSALTRTRRLEVVNGKDVVIAKIEASASGNAQIQLLGADGAEQLELNALGAEQRGGDIIALKGADGKNRMQMVLSRSPYGDLVSFILRNGSVSVVNNKKETCTAMDGQSITVTKVLTEKELDALVHSPDDEMFKNKRVTLGAFDDGGGFVQVHNSRGKVVAEMQSSKANSGLIMANDFDGNLKESLSGK